MGNDVIWAEHRKGKARLVGLFASKGQPCVVRANVPDGRYVNLIDGKVVVAEQGLVTMAGEPVIIRIEA